MAKGKGPAGPRVTTRTPDAEWPVYDKRPAYTLTGAAARGALAKAGVDLSSDDKRVRDQALRDAEAKPGPLGQLAMHTRKWLPDDASTVLIRLSDAEAKALKGHGLKLTPAP